MDYKELHLIGSSSPHIRTKDGTAHIMAEVLIALIPALAFSIYNFGWYVLTVTAVSVVGSCFFEWLYRTLMKKNNTVGDCSAAVTGVLIAFVCPPNIPLWMILIGDFFAIVIVKQLFGGIGKNFLNPALAARAFMLSWASAMSTWVVPGSKLPLLGTVDVVTSATPMSYLHENNLQGLMEVYDLQDMLIGFIGGSLGEVSALLLAIGGAWLIFRKIITWYIPVSYIGTVAVLTFLFPRGNDPMTWMLYNVLGGGLILGAFFMATDYVTRPITIKGQYVYGAVLGLLTGIFRIFGPGAEGVSYAIILGNLLVPLIEKFTMPVAFGRKAGAKREK